jgi:hypothetical protein
MQCSESWSSARIVRNASSVRFPEPKSSGSPRPTFSISAHKREVWTARSAASSLDVGVEPSDAAQDRVRVGPIAGKV